MKRLSIIVPMYNVEPYVERCLRRIEDQDIPKDDYEIICINNGSPDNSREVVIRLQKEFTNIKLIDQENLGVSCARNNGTDAASGKYILYIDPDDYIDAKCFNRILKNADKQKAQITFLGFTFLNEDGTIRTRVFNEDLTSQIYTGTDAYSLSRGDGRTDPDRMWAVLYEAEFLNRNNLRFLANVPYLEDGEFIARILCLAERCIFDGHSFYQRTTRPGSATNSNLFFREVSTKGFLLAANNLKSFQNEHTLNDKQRMFLNQPVTKFVLLAVSSATSWRSFRRFKATIRNLREIGYKRVRLKGCSRIYRFYGRAYNFSPYLAALALLLYPRINRLFNILRRS